ANRRWLQQRPTELGRGHRHSGLRRVRSRHAFDQSARHVRFARARWTVKEQKWGIDPARGGHCQMLDRAERGPVLGQLHEAIKAVGGAVHAISLPTDQMGSLRRFTQAAIRLAASAISASVVSGPKLNRIAERKTSSGTPIARNTGDGKSDPLEQA